jgi:hypothetical protein
LFGITSKYALWFIGTAARTPPKHRRTWGGGAVSLDGSPMGLKRGRLKEKNKKKKKVHGSLDLGGVNVLWKRKESF